MRAPASRMDILNGDEIKDLIKVSELVDKYNEEIDRESAYEMLNEKIEKLEEEMEDVPEVKERRTTRRRGGKTLVEEITSNSSFKIIVRDGVVVKPCRFHKVLIAGRGEADDFRPFVPCA